MQTHRKAAAPSKRQVPGSVKVVARSADKSVLSSVSPADGRPAFSLHIHGRLSNRTHCRRHAAAAAAAAARRSSPPALMQLHATRLRARGTPFSASTGMIARRRRPWHSNGHG